MNYSTHKFFLLFVYIVHVHVLQLKKSSFQANRTVRVAKRNIFVESKPAPSCYSPWSHLLHLNEDTHVHGLYYTCTYTCIVHFHLAHLHCLESAVVSNVYILMSIFRSVHFHSCFNSLLVNESIQQILSVYNFRAKCTCLCVN